jgi:ribonuclease HI
MLPEDIVRNLAQSGVDKKTISILTEVLTPEVMNCLISQGALKDGNLSADISMPSPNSNNPVVIVPKGVANPIPIHFTKQLKCLQPPNSKTEEIPQNIVFTDGGCSSNGKKDAKAAFAVYFGDNDPNNFSKSFTDEPSNQKAELMAIQKALDILLLHGNYPPGSRVVICSDSMYSINCLTKWYDNWTKNGWLTASKKPVKHKDIITNCQALINALERTHTVTVSFEHVFSHTFEPRRNTLDWTLWNGNRNADLMVQDALRK